jgi:tight adherence protein C
VFSNVLGFATALAPARIRHQAETELEQAGQPMSLNTFLVLRAVAMFGLPIIYVWLAIRMAGQLTPFILVTPLVLFWMGQRLPRMWLKQRIRSRIRSIERALPGALDLITVSMEAGLAFDAALGKVVEKTRGPLADEFDRALAEMTLGKPRRDALRDLSRRIPTRDMASFISAVVQADQMGIPLGQIMRGLADELRTKRRQRAEEEAMKIPIKMLFPLIFLIFPSMLIVVMGPAMVIIITKVFGTITGR